MSRVKKEKIIDATELLNSLWNFIHDRLNEDIKNNRKDSSQALGEVASFIRKNSSSELLKKINTKEYYK